MPKVAKGKVQYFDTLKNIFHSFSTQKRKQVDEKIRLLDFLAKNITPYAAKQLEITFRISLTLFKAFLKL